MTSSFGPSVIPPTPADALPPMALAALPKPKAMMVAIGALGERGAIGFLSRFQRASKGAQPHLGVVLSKRAVDGCLASVVSWGNMRFVDGW